MMTPDGTPGVLERVVTALGTQRGALLLVATVATLAFGAGFGAFPVFSDLSTHEERITDLEEWQAGHEVDMMSPLARLERSEVRVDTLITEVTQVRAMVYQLYCDRWPERCTSRPEPND